MRVTNIRYGSLTEGAVSLECVQDVFGLPSAVFAPPATSLDPGMVSDPAPMEHRLVMEAPYWQLIQGQGESFTVDSTDAYLLVAGSAPTQDAFNARIWVDEGGSTYEEFDAFDFCPSAELDEDLPIAIDGVLQVTVGLTDGVDLDIVEVGDACSIDDEVCEVVAVPTIEVTLGRGCLDTVPANHLAGARIIFWGTSSGSNDRLYQESEALNVKLTPTTGNGTLDVSLAPGDSVTFVARADKPYPPGNFKINDTYFPDTAEISIEASWAHRDRTLTTAGLYDFTEPDTGPEPGTTYNVLLIRTDTEATLESYTGVTGTNQTLAPAYTGEVKLTITAARDGEESFQSQEHTFFYGSAGIMQYEDGSPMQYEDGTYMTYEEA
jgi:hypothetical protein